MAYPSRKLGLTPFLESKVDMFELLVGEIAEGQFQIQSLAYRDGSAYKVVHSRRRFPHGAVK